MRIGIGVWGLCLLASSASLAGEAIRLEAENGKLADLTATTQPAGTTQPITPPGFSGIGYVAGFKNQTGVLTFENVKPPAAGLYDLSIGYSTPSGHKGYELTVNGVGSSGMFDDSGPKFAVHPAGKVELNADGNTISIGKGWGSYLIDYIELTPSAPLTPPAKPPRTPVDPNATPQARALLGKLIDLYGTKMLSGVYGDKDAEYIHEVTGKYPAILGGDLMEYSPSRVAHGAKPDGTVEHLIEQHRAGYVLTVSWHWNAPSHLIDKVGVDEKGNKIDAAWWRGFYTHATTFDVERALANPGSDDYRAIVYDIDSLAVQLRKFSDAGVPILWRPLHEAEGGWFWWGAKGPKPFVALWRLMFDRLTRHHGLHNMLWVYTATPNPDWYPGDAYVDVVGIDAYPRDRRDPQSETWEALRREFDGKKLLAVSEFGSAPDVDRMWRVGADWSYFVTWNGMLDPAKISREALKQVYDSPLVVNRGDLQRP